MFDNVAAFTAHRKDGLKCTVPTATDGKNAATAATDKTTPKKAEGEPDGMLCFLCQKSFDHAWLLIDHISKGHGISVYHTAKVYPWVWGQEFGLMGSISF